LGGEARVIGYSRLRQLHRAGLEGLGFADVLFQGINTALNVGAQAFNAYTAYENLQNKQDELKLKQRTLAAEQQALADAKALQERLAQQALQADREAASAGIAAAAAARSEVPAWVWVAGAALVGGGAIYLMRQRGRRR